MESTNKKREIYVVYTGGGGGGKGQFISYKNRIQNNYFEIKLKLINKVFNWIRPTREERLARVLDRGKCKDVGGGVRGFTPTG